MAVVKQKLSESVQTLQFSSSLSKSVDLDLGVVGGNMKEW